MTETSQAGQRVVAGTTAVVTGASRGFGRAVAAALCGAGARVVGIARDGDRLAAVRDELGDAFVPLVADAADPVVAGQLIDRYRPATLVLNAGAAPLCRPLHQQTWESFSRNWEVDVRQAFGWVREALLAPLDPGSTVVAFSSGAAIGGSPVSGGYAGAKATIRFLASYAEDESRAAGLGVRFLAVLPNLTPETDTGAAAVAAYARRQGVSTEEFLAARGAVLSPERVGELVLDLVADNGYTERAYALDAAGLAPLK